MKILEYFGSPDEPRGTRWLLLAFVPLLALYLVAAKGNSETKNHDVYANDQKVYLNTAKKIADDFTGYFTPRQRTPGYPYFLSMFYSPEYGRPEGAKPPFDLAWFERGKTINLYLSVALLAGLFLFCRLYLPRVESGVVTVASGLLLFTFKAGYVQPELSYWVLNTVLFVLLGRMLLAPSWWLAAVCGALSTVTYFVKAGTQPLLFLFAVTWCLKLLWDGWRSRGGRGERPNLAVLAGQGALVILLYMLLLLPYFIGTAKKFGKPFYSVYTEYMMWLPLDDEAGDFRVNRDFMWGYYYAGARNQPITVEEFNAALERTVRERLVKEAKEAGWDEDKLERRVAKEFKPVEELANPGEYFARYDLAHSVERVKNGLHMVNKRIKKYYKRAGEMVEFAFSLLLLGLLLRVLAALLHRRGAGAPRLRFDRDARGAIPLSQTFAERPYLLFYAAGFFVGYAVLYAWYDALGIGPRLMLSLYVPLLFLAVWAVWHVFRPLVFTVRDKPIYLGKLVNIALLGKLVYLSCKLMTGELYEFMNTGG